MPVYQAVKGIPRFAFVARETTRDSQHVGRSQSRLHKNSYSQRRSWAFSYRPEAWRAIGARKEVGMKLLGVSPRDTSLLREVSARGTGCADLFIYIKSIFPCQQFDRKTLKHSRCASKCSSIKILNKQSHIHSLSTCPQCLSLAIADGSHFYRISSIIKM